MASGETSPNKIRRVGPNPAAALPSDGRAPEVKPPGLSSNPLSRVSKPKISAGQEFTKEDEEAQDEVIAEADIFLNHLQDPEAFLGELVMMQYPHRSVFRPVGDQGKLKTVEFDPKLKYMRMKYKLDTYADHYNKAAKSQQKESVIRGVPASNKDVSFCIMAVHKGQVVLTPLSAFLQCRTEVEQEEESSDEEEANSLEVQEVKVSTKVESKLQSMIAEPKLNWELMTHFDNVSRETRDCYNQFFDFKRDVVEFKKDDAAAMFVHQLCGACDITGASGDTASQGQFLTSYVMSRLSLEEQVQALLWESKTKGMSYKEIRTRLAGQTKKTMSPTALMDCLQKICVMVSNVWFLQNEFMGFDDWLGRVREAIMLVLHKTNQMKIKKINDLFGRIVPKELLRDIASSLGEVAKDTDMEDKITLHEPEDKIGDTHPEIKAKYTEYWDMRTKESVRKVMEQARTADPLTGAKVRQLQESRLRVKLQHEVRVLLCMSARTIPDLKKRCQQRHPNNNISETLLQSVLSKATMRASALRELWFLNSVEGWTDPYRRLLLELFKEDSFIKMADLVTEIENRDLNQLTDLRLRQLVSEFANLEGDRWVFREE